MRYLALCLALAGCIEDPQMTHEREDDEADAALEVDGGPAPAPTPSPQTEPKPDPEPECEEPGLRPPCPDGWTYDPRADVCGVAESDDTCRERSWCGQRHTCRRYVSPPAQPPCGPGETVADGPCDPEDPRCSDPPGGNDEPFQCLDPRCADELPGEGEPCPDVPGARTCFPNEVACRAGLTWCGRRFPGCMVDDGDCGAPPRCPPDTLNLRRDRCDPRDSDGICDWEGPCREGDVTCATYAACDFVVACFDPRCEGFVLGACPDGMTYPTPAERRACRAGERDDCYEHTECDQTLVCVPAG